MANHRQVWRTKERNCYFIGRGCFEPEVHGEKRRVVMGSRVLGGGSFSLAGYCWARRKTSFLLLGSKASFFLPRNVK